MVFDANMPIVTPVWMNTVDGTAPTSHVRALAASQDTSQFTVQWEGSDVGSGIQTYSIFVFDNDGPPTTWIASISASLATFTGQAGHRYGFFSVAVDQVGNVEPMKAVAHAITTVGAAPTCATDVTNVITITRSGFGYSFASGRFLQTLTLTNTGPATLVGPLAIVFDNYYIRKRLWRNGRDNMRSAARAAVRRSVGQSDSGRN